MFLRFRYRVYGFGSVFRRRCIDRFACARALSHIRARELVEKDSWEGDGEGKTRERERVCRRARQDASKGRGEVNFEYARHVRAFIHED